MEKSLSLDQLNFQLSTLRNDEKIFKEKLFGVMGAIKVVEHFINEINSKEVGGNNG